MEFKNNKILLGSLILIAVSIAYYLLIYSPKQKEISLRKQVYELCLKEWNDYYDKSADFANKEIAEKRLTQNMTEQEWKQEMGDKLMPLINSKDEITTNCVEKRINEYKK